MDTDALYKGKGLPVSLMMKSKRKVHVGRSFYGVAALFYITMMRTKKSAQILGLFSYCYEYSAPATSHIFGEQATIRLVGLGYVYELTIFFR